MADGAAESIKAPTAFFSRTYDEAMALLIETRSYADGGAAVERRNLPLAGALRMCSEMTRVTARLSQVMAWLLVQRAVHAGELTPAEATDEAHRLGGHDACLDASLHDDPYVPSGLNSLLERSHKLYVRVSRLDELAARAPQFARPFDRLYTN